MRRARRNLRYLLIAAVVGLFALGLVLFVNAYNGGGGDSAGGVRLHPSGTSSGNEPAPSASPRSPARHTRSPNPGGSLTALPTTVPRLTISPGEPGGFVYKNLPRHKIVLRVTSTANILAIGYLVPRSPNASYGIVKHGLGRTWSLRTTAIGTPYYAALFVQAGQRGDPVTCTIEVDGKIANSETTKAAYGRQVCIG